MWGTDQYVELTEYIFEHIAAATLLLLPLQVWGAVQQEWRVSRALEVLMVHVENVAGRYERDHHELTEIRKYAGSRI